MTIRIKIEKKENYLLVISSGFDDDADDVINYASSVYEKAIQYQTPNILCDERDLVYKIHEIDTFKVAENVSRYAPKLKKLAIVCNKDFVDDAEFFENVAFNRGLTVRVFCDYDKAVDWLLDI